SRQGLPSNTCGAGRCSRNVRHNAIQVFRASPDAILIHAARTFQRFIDTVLGGLPLCLPQVDDLLFLAMTRPNTPNTCVNFSSV
uniref:Uncharacterized protein n=2 Tax=Ixodes scapularis TaxID=6945 RepID=A0A1S4LFR9_IXOSC